MTEDSVAAQRDFWIAQHNEAQQNVQCLRFWLVMALHSPLDSESLEKVRVLLDRTKP